MYFLKLNQEANLEKILELGHTHVGKECMKLEKWKEGTSYDSIPKETMQIWFKLRNIPPHMYNAEALSHFSSLLGKPLYMDKIIEENENLTYARINVEVQPRSVLPNKITVVDRKGNATKMVDDHAVDDHADHQPALAELNDFEDSVMSNQENPSDHEEQNDLDVAVVHNDAPSPPLQPQSVEDVREDILDESVLVEPEDVEAEPDGAHKVQTTTVEDDDQVEVKEQVDEPKSPPENPNDQGAGKENGRKIDVLYEGAPGNITRQLLRSMQMGREISSEVIDAWLIWSMMPPYFPNPLKKT
ncbi:uncharacterized protein LOC124934865 [Impatiens glandulifera]|uniref:uncharacterized protein LOC124934865 n=1 Tax=Impatiens glandulifera TaxID=253017 RepID=UPI001FB16076|nr:uncharacterized protein LOC124934865 [Impatiens glandulifera]